LRRIAAWFISIIFLLAGYNQISSAKSLKDSDDQQVVRVRLQKELSSLEVSGKSLSIANQEKVVEPVSINSEYTRIQISKTLINKKLFWQVVEFRFGKLFRTQIFGGRYLSVKGVDLHSGTKALPSSLLLSGEKKIDLIGLVHLREYLIGVVSSEMPLSWPKEALKAQAIASRSYAIALMQERRRNIFQLESSILDQVYSPAVNIQWHPEQLKNVISAVDETSGVMLIKNNKVLKAYYHADCGGLTASSASVFGSKELVGGVVDASCPTNPKAHWQYKISRKELSEKVSHFFHNIGPIPTLNRIFALGTKMNPRVESVILAYADGSDRRVNSNQFREIVGYQDLKSTLFKIQEKRADYLFTGVGYGHGVGLCQWGSKGLAMQGASHNQILLHYYPEAKLNVLSLESAEHLHSEKTNSDNNHNVL
jgi:stage II sporulation protein D